MLPKDRGATGRANGAGSGGVKVAALGQRRPLPDGWLTARPSCVVCKWSPKGASAMLVVPIFLFHCSLYFCGSLLELIKLLLWSWYQVVHPFWYLLTCIRRRCWRWYAADMTFLPCSIPATTWAHLVTTTCTDNEPSWSFPTPTSALTLCTRGSVLRWIKGNR